MGYFLDGVEGELVMQAVPDQDGERGQRREMRKQQEPAFTKPEHQ